MPFAGIAPVALCGLVVIALSSTVLQTERRSAP
jgi:hypothetical protein